ncbi:MAG: radical SAM family heme chaperone HemW [Flavihumibacter sp.]|nr:radical SAM family heme chaperone HemW [Flavihumibacter sp.]
MAGIYIHIPFCRKACHYCNFHFSTQLDNKLRMVKAIARELTERAPIWRDHPIETLYFGGGTPSLLSQEELNALLSVVRDQFYLSPTAEITLEANPDDLSSPALDSWQAAGINRLSIGIQSFHETDLRWMNRAHTAVEAREGLKRVQAAGFENFSIDLIYGTPGLSDEAWMENMEIAISSRVPHLSCYALTVEEKTALAHLVKSGRMPDTDPEQQSRQFLLLMETVRKAGYEHYEISNFALPGYRSRHNSSYWSGTLYLGAGPGAHSFDGHSRRWNISNNALYIKAIETGENFHEEEVLTKENRRHEYIMTALRTAEGLDMRYYTDQYGLLETKLLEKKLNQYLELTRKEGPERLVFNSDRIQLTDEGRLFADGIASYFF